jgi:hypothetical protein
VTPLTSQLSAAPAGQFDSDAYFPGDDNQIIRVGGDTVLNLKAGGTTHSLEPRPQWWNTVEISGQNVPGYRVTALFYKSVDRGRTWGKNPFSLDAARVAFPLQIIGAGQGVEVGRSAWPQFDPNGKREQGGWDRPDAYFCPWTGRLYVHLNSESGNPQDDHATGVSLLFVSEDGGLTWDTDQNGNLVPRYGFDPPYFFVVAMTSRPNGNFYLYHTGAGQVPTLMLSINGGRTFTSKPVYFTDDNGTQRLNEGFDNQIPVGLEVLPRNAWTHAISRTRSGVRVAYCSRGMSSQGIRQVYNIVSIDWDSPVTEPAVTSVAELAAQDASGHVLYATFIESDRFELDRANLSDATLLYWVETSGNKFFTRASVMHGPTGWNSPFSLSTRQWTPKNNDFAIGDYMKGAFFYDGRSLNFVALWPEVVPGVSAECCYRIISIAPDPR